MVETRMTSTMTVLQDEEECVLHPVELPVLLSVPPPVTVERHW